MARKKLDAVKEIEIVLENNKFMASSMQIAKHFGKSHNNVLRDIRNLIQDLPEEWASINFEPIEENVVLPASGGIRKDPAYRVTRDGFAMLAMGFTGKEALEWKIKYILAFNQMETALVERLQKEKALMDKKVAALEGDSEKLKQVRISFEKLLEGQQVHKNPNDLPHEIRQDKFLHGLIAYWAYLDKMPQETAHAIINELTLTTAKDDYQITVYKFIQKMIHKPKKEGAEPVNQHQLDIIKALADSCDQLQWIDFKFSEYTNTIDAFIKQHGNCIQDLAELSKEGADRYINLMFAHFMASVRHTYGRNNVRDICLNIINFV
ncbi:MAG: Rha family transcriptional regulator [Deltaproteobacteria bacterium]|jgi:Rha family phage regulatory protein|nr:Rha family transcriptional regulator [Deltaproteobacteria bacterium]